MEIVLDHIVLNVENVQAAISFYQSVLGLKAERLEKFEKGLVPFPSVRINEVTVIDIFPPEMWKTEGVKSNSAKINLNHFCLTLTESDWKRLIERLHLNNIEITRYADDNWGARGNGISVYFNDVDGNEIEARYYPD
jgi:catechol 2,3-dioxygenase-like lactoylglutathione lyase family enzyme